MADRLKDADDEFLEQLFRERPIADDGFSRRVVTHLRRRLLIRRFTMPLAALIGLSVAIKPMLALTAVATKLLIALPQQVVPLPMHAIAQPLYLLAGALLLIVCMVGSRVFDDV